jgi:hypothetical protein
VLIHKRHTALSEAVRVDPNLTTNGALRPMLFHQECEMVCYDDLTPTNRFNHRRKEGVVEKTSRVSSPSTVTRPCESLAVHHCRDPCRHARHQRLNHRRHDRQCTRHRHLAIIVAALHPSSRSRVVVASAVNSPQDVETSGHYRFLAADALAFGYQS